MIRKILIYIPHRTASPYSGTRPGMLWVKLPRQNAIPHDYRRSEHYPILLQY